ncbi:hypothetical protein VTJ04DRAFT_8496 [Mycothermus thermophilus]|uniref:uncharacterized protein n=1 Tax=Humicola insolens TaxID=85995 RepID=UPI0037425C2D
MGWSSFSFRRWKGSNADAGLHNKASTSTNETKRPTGNDGGTVLGGWWARLCWGGWDIEIWPIVVCMLRFACLLAFTGRAHEERLAWLTYERMTGFCLGMTGLDGMGVWLYLYR